MAEYNTAFFTAYSNLLKVLKEELGEEKALYLFTEVIIRGLKSAYDTMSFTKGNANDFARMLKTRDESVGLKVEFPLISDNKIIYQFHTDPFPQLKGVVAPEELDSTYMKFKVTYLLGSNWNYKTTKHIWKGDKFTEHLIERK